MESVRAREAGRGGEKVFRMCQFRCLNQQPPSNSRLKTLEEPSHILIQRILPPLAYYLLPSFEHLLRLLHKLVEQAQLAGNEVCIVGITGPGADVHDIEGLVDEVSDRGQLVQE